MGLTKTGMLLAHASRAQRARNLLILPLRGALQSVLHAQAMRMQKSWL